MSKHIQFTNGILSARYDSAINAVVPADAIEVSDDVFLQTINESDGIWSLVNGEIVKLPHPAPTTAELKQSKRLEINAAFEQSMQQITGGYPASETSSWAKQETEARAYIADNTAPAPLLDALAATRGVAKADLVSRIIAKADLFAAVSGQLIGHRQGLEDALDALPETATIEDIAAIIW
jgi:hypothetical protein